MSDGLTAGEAGLPWVDPTILGAIAGRDPDGGATEPTDADYGRFRSWVIGEYGEDVWAVYRRGGWIRPEF